MQEFYNEVIVESVNETIIDPVNNTELSYCAGCDWIIQEFHDEWATHNSKPYKTEKECRAARREQRDQNPDTIFRCIHESELQGNGVEPTAVPLTPQMESKLENRGSVAHAHPRQLSANPQDLHIR